ncbi:hypothetical protein F984_02439 [Acinetobacter nosocomialis NIPH 2119]|nr:hypothetical protein F984_02439 [Acinetobacter nosocomialis NIPH 2119]
MVFALRLLKSNTFMQQFLALSVVAPNGTYIAQGVKTLEVRSWVPTELPLKDLLIVKNKNFLINDGDEG